jgi:DNA-binding response OmpR family regulator
MPKFSGFELCQSFRSLSYTSTIPILVITGETEAKYKDHCANLGAVAYFEKPLKLDELRRRLAMELQSKRSDAVSSSRATDPYTNATRTRFAKGWSADRRTLRMPIVLFTRALHLSKYRSIPLRLIKNLTAN